METVDKKTLRALKKFAYNAICAAGRYDLLVRLVADSLSIEELRSIASKEMDKHDRFFECNE